MPDQAKVISVDAIESFRTSLILYLSKARPTLEEVNSDVLRLRLWLENDQRNFWEAQIRRRTKALEEAQQALYTARVANLRDSTTAELQAVRRTKSALDEAVAKLRVVKKWSQQFESSVEPLARQLEKLHTVLSSSLPQAVAHLGSLVNTLHAYAERGPVSSPVETPASEPVAEKEST